jgi:RNA polymerase sigma-70 factor (ECF subfamily)
MSDPAAHSFPCILRAWNAHEGELRNFLRHRAGDPHLADDLLQEVFVKAMQQGKQFCSLDNERAWLFQVARNALVDHHRLSKETEAVPEDIPAEECGREPIVGLSVCVARVLSELSAEDREIIEQCDLEGVKQQDYATRHGLSLSAAKSRLLRAREKMRSHMSVACQVQFDEVGRVSGHVPRK